MAPIILGMIPFGLIAGIASVEVGMPAWGAGAFSAIIFAGAAQLAALDLLAGDAGPLVVIGTIAIINTRFVMYSASLAVRFDGEPLWRRVLMSYFLTDQAYVVTITKLDAQPSYRPRLAFYLGGALSLWSAWQVSTLVGAVAGAIIPDSVPLAFAFPLVFIALMVPAIVDRATLSAALSSGVVAVAAADLPANLGLLAAAGTGITVGYLASRRAGGETG
ncbi:AzlC family ABC transporter permease [Euzebya tangerina]|uniref:AzlC family ABC transporter permease n=1 Tax=Euzebya tangerina TaxID=591198 RepID=UPI000E31C462|nr:AzlC family ABC transporter permease [Euzebya tangerina]